jgi:hypothetical protein
LKRKPPTIRRICKIAARHEYQAHPRANDVNDRDQELRTDLMALQIERLRQEIRIENRKFLALLAALVSSSVLAVIVGVIVAHLIPMH